MNFLAKKTTWSNMELWLFKACIFSGGITAGIYFYNFIDKYMMLFLLFFIITTIGLTYLWLKKMKQKTDQ